MELFKAHSDTAKIELLFVLFYNQENLTEVTWKEKFMKEQLDRLALRYIDTKEFLLRYSQENHIPLSSFYKPGDGHHNNLGNQVIAEGIVGYLQTFPTFPHL